MLTIRAAVPGDVPALAHLLGQLFQQEAEFAPDRETQMRGLTAIIANPAVGQVLVAERSSRTIGMTNMLYTVSTALGARVAILEDVVVDEACRGLGFGRKLLEAAIAAARNAGCRRITLLTDGDNARAHAFYGSFGFERSSMVPFRLMLDAAR